MSAGVTGVTAIAGKTGDVELSDLAVSDENLTATDLEAAISELAARVDALE